MKSRILIRGPLSAFTGYGQHIAAIVQDFTAFGYHVSVWPTSVLKYYAPIPPSLAAHIVNQEQPEDFELIVAPGDVAPTPGKRTVYFTMWESTVIPKQMAEYLNACEAVIVPSQWNASCFSACGVTAPIHVCPLGYDDSIFKPGKSERNKDVVFGVAGGFWEDLQNRKNVQTVVAAFKEAHKEHPEITLHVKLFPGRNEVSKLVHPAIVVTRAFLEDLELAKWFQQLDYFISVPKGGAFEMMGLQAMACGVPLVCCKYGGSHVYADYARPAIVRSIQVPAGGPYEGAWGQVHESELKIVTEILLTDREWPLSHDASVATAVDWGWASCNERLLFLLQDIGAIQIPPIPAGIFPEIESKNPEDIILAHYRDLRAIPKRARPQFSTEEVTLTNIPHGLGDTVILTDLPRKASLQGKPAHIFSASPFFRDLMPFNPFYREGQTSHLLPVSILLDEYDCGNGHTIQRIQRAFGFQPDLLPKGCIHYDGVVKRGRVAMHFDAGVHGDWQRQHIHPRARMIYPQTHQQIQQFVSNNPHMEFVSVGSRGTDLKGVEDKSNQTLETTIKLLAGCEYFIGIISGPYHVAVALGLKTIVIVNFPSAEQIVLPTLVDAGVLEMEWIGPQSCVLHQEGESELVKRVTAGNLDRAVNGELYPFWKNDYLPLIHEPIRSRG